MEIALRETPGGRLLCARDGEAVEVQVYPCFPLSHPTAFISLAEVVGGNEIALVESLDDLDARSRGLLEQHLHEKTFAIEITAILSVAEGPSSREWQVETSSGARKFLSPLDAWPRVLDTGGVVIQDISEDLYVVPEIEELDAKSRRMLWALMD